MKALEHKRIEHSNHQLDIKIYERFIWITAIMNLNDLAALSAFGVESERKGLHRLSQMILSGDYPGLHFFSNDNEFLDWYNRTFDEKISDSNGTWAKTVIIDLPEFGRKKALQQAMDYIEQKSEDYSWQ